MKLKSIKATNFKGADFDRHLSGCEVFTGPNGSGKSRILEAVEIALLGFIPGSRYKRTADLFAAYATDRDEVLRTHLTMGAEDDQIPLSRAIGWNKAKTTISQQINFLGSTGVKAQEELIAKHLNPCIEALDFSKFEEMSQRDQERYLLRLAGEPEGVSRNDVLAKLAALSTNDEVMEELIQIWPQLGDLTVSEGILAIEEKLRKMKAADEKEARKVSGAEDLLAEIEEDHERLAGDVVTAKRALEDAQDREKVLIKAVEAETSKAGEHERWTTTQTKLESDVNLSKTNLDNIQAGDGHDYDAQVKLLEAKIHGEEKIEQVKAELTAIEAKLPDLEEAEKQAKGKKDAVNVSIRAHEQLLVIIAGEDSPKCPLVPSLEMECPVDWDEMREGILDGIAHLKGVERESVVTGWSAAEDAFSVATSENDQATATIQRYEKENTNLNLNIKGILSQKKTHSEHVALLEKGTEDAEKRLADHVAAEPHSEGVADVEKLNQELTGLKERIPKLKQDHEAKVMEKGRTLAKLEAIKQRLLLGERIKVIKVLLDAAQKILAETLEQVLDPMTEVINRNLLNEYEALIGPSEFDNDRKFRIGMVINGDERSLISLSTGERAMFAAAVAVAFMKAKGSKLKILLVDNLECVDAEKRNAFIDLMAIAVVSGELDNFLGCSVASVPDGEGYDVWPLTVEAGVA